MLQAQSISQAKICGAACLHSSSAIAEDTCFSFWATALFHASFSSNDSASAFANAVGENPNAAEACSLDTLSFHPALSS